MHTNDPKKLYQMYSARRNFVMTCFYRGLCTEEKKNDALLRLYGEYRKAIGSQIDDMIEQQSISENMYQGRSL
jgi:hypothetical protein